MSSIPIDLPDAVSVCILGWNEEKKIREVVLNVIDEAKRAGGLTLDIMVVNDGSTDGTANVIAQLEKEFPFVRGIHNEVNLGFGESFKKAIAAAKYEKITLLPGDNAVTRYSMRNVFKYRNEADWIVAYTVNTETRTMFRYCLSTIFSLVYSVAFGLHIRYMNGTPIFPVSRLRKMTLYGGYSILSQVNVKLARQGLAYMETSGYLNEKEQVSSVLRIRILIQEVTSFVRLWMEIYFWDRELYSKKPKRIIPEAE